MASGITLFGPGVAWGVRNDVSGASPCNFGKVIEVSLQIAATVKPLTGGSQAPIDFGRGALKITGKLKMAEVSPLAISSLFWGVTPGAGSTLVQYLEAGSVAAATPYEYTVVNGATFVAALEVLYASTGLPLQQVATAPAAGQYSVGAGGVLTFAAADASKAILVSYTYTAAAQGYGLTVSNQLQGFTPTFAVTLYNVKNGKPVVYSLPFCTAEKLGRDGKEEAFTNPEIDILVGANAAGQIITENYPQLS